MSAQTVLIGGLSLWGLQYVFAWALCSLTPSQMRQEYPGESILPLVWHGGIWFDLPLTFWLAYLVSQHPEWTKLQWAIAIAIGAIASWCAHKYVYAPATVQSPHPYDEVTQESHVQNGEVTFVGWIHAVYFAVAIAIVGLELFCSVNPSKDELWAHATILSVLLAVGNHFVLGLARPADYHGDPLRSGTGWLTVLGGIAILAVITVIRVGF